MYTLTYLRLFTFTLDSIQPKIVETIQKVKILQLKLGRGAKCSTPNLAISSQMMMKLGKGKLCEEILTN